MRWIDPRDQRAMGDAETIVDCGQAVLYGLVVPASRGGTLGMLAIKCVRVGGFEQPVSLAIADSPIVVDTTLMSNPRRCVYRDDAA